MMSEDPTISDLEAQLQKSIELQNELKLKLSAAKEEAKKNLPLKITISALVGNHVYISNDPERQDALDVFRSIKGRTWKGIERVNSIPIGEYSAAIAALSALPKAELIYVGEVKAKIEEYLYEPDFKCELGPRQFVVKAAQRAYTYTLTKIPGHNFNYQTHKHEIPFSEGWRLYEFAKAQTSFQWSEDALKFVSEQIENRLRLDEIAKAEDVELTIPGLRAVLKNYQKVGIKYFDTNGARGILGDEMGTGKTLQMIGLVTLRKFKALIVCPASLKENWLREIRKFAPEGTTTVTLQGEAPSKFDIAKLLTQTPDYTIINYDIIGRSFEFQRDAYHKETRYPWVEALNLCPFDIVICDEAHYIKNTDSNRSKAVIKLEQPHAIMMTGTPILNRPGELWPMLHKTDPITFPAFDTFRKQYTFDGKTVKNVDELKQLLRPLMIRRLKKDVIKELPPINRINSYFELSERGRKLYDKVLLGVFEILKDWNPNQAGSEKEVANMLVQIQRLKQVVAIDAVESTVALAVDIYDSSPAPEEGPPNKVLIFSQFKATTFAISKRLNAEDTSINRALSFVNYTGGGINGFVTGDHSWQQKCIDQFQSDPNIHFLCVTEKTAKEGHNITAAHAVIFNDLFWTPAGHQQAEARAYGRVSDLHTIDSYYRIGINSISEKIMDILASKLAIIEQVVEGVEASRADTSIVHDLLKSLKEELWTFKKKEK